MYHQNDTVSPKIVGRQIQDTGEYIIQYLLNLKISHLALVYDFKIKSHAGAAQKFLPLPFYGQQ